MSDGLLDTCHLWQVALGAEPNATHLLDTIEHARAARFRFERDRRRYIASRIALRKILGAYLDRDPVQIVFHIGAHGRPSLAGVPTLQFNITHSEELALIAVTAQGPLGVDVESLREMERALDLARRYLHPNELRLVEAAAPAERSINFLTCWTRKEAVLKSIGVGLTTDTRRLDVGAAPIEKALDLPGFPALRVISLEPEKGFIAACATAPHVRFIELRRFEP